MAFEQTKSLIRARMAAEMQDIGVEIVTDIQEALSVPVEYLPGGRIVRSVRGEPPRYETGNLYRRTDYDVDTSTPRLNVTNDAEYAVELEDDLGRPFFSTARENWTPKVGPRLRDAAQRKR